MFSRTICFFAVLCVCVGSRKSIALSGNSSSEIQMNSHTLRIERLIKSPHVFKSGETRTKPIKVLKRGIVLVDEDFDVPSAIYAHENNSGVDTDLKTDLLDSNEGSGNDVLGEKESSKATKDDIKLEPDYNTTTVLTQSTKEMESELIKDVSTLIDIESSGDGILLNTTEYPTTEIATKSYTESGHEVHDEVSDICMNSTCSLDDLIVSMSEDSKLIAEGTNLTLSCKSNNSNHNMLYWYRSNGTVHFLQAFGKEEELLLNVPDTKPIHTGIYKCVKWVKKQTCCNLKLHLTVYEVPLYKYHLILIGLIAVACLIICIFLSVRQIMVLKTYTHQFVKKHGSVKQQLL